MTSEHIGAVLGAQLPLPCGALLPNRIAKAAMTEQMADASLAPNEKHIRLYETWGKGGTGLIITGNVMVDRRYLEHPANVAVEDGRDMEMLQRWAAACKAEGSAAWVQLSHPGRQCPKVVTKQPVAPSAIPLKGLESLFATARPLTDDEIENIIERFATAAEIVFAAGFDGVQIHGAHGYLASQFLSPLANRRDDRWGGPLKNRMRFLLSVVKAVRARVGTRCAIGVKLNSADFQRGGFDESESMAVVQALNSAGIDLLEISGGNYEKPAMVGRPERTRQREAFFMDYAEQVRKVATMPLMLTGGFRSAAGMAGAVASGAIDVVGVARPLAVEPDLPNRILVGTAQEAVDVKVQVGVKLLDDMLQSFWYGDQLRRMGDGQLPNPKRSRYASLARGLWTSLPF